MGAVGDGRLGGGFDGGSMWSSTGTILVLFILLVIITRTFM